MNDRFEIERVAGVGGMGTVYRALDRTTGEPVALKVLRAGSGEDERFAREIRVLATLHHPGVVRYIADGRTPTGEMWLAMEWLDGESLQERLARQALSANEAVEVARRIAEALGAAHERGIVHRDVKPSNLMFEGGALDRVKVLDFGVARMTDAMRNTTRTGVVIGTPGYMAPEQVRGEKDVGPRADVFAVGCVLFECLTGRQAFGGDHMMAVLAKIILEEAPRVTELHPDMPPALDELVARTLAKRPEDRPRDGSELAAELAALGRIAASSRPPTITQSPALTATERRLLSVILIGDEGEQGDRTFAGTPGSRLARARGHETITNEVPPESLPALGEVARRFGAQLERLANGSYVATLTGSGGARDRVTNAARCALAMKPHVGSAPMALATGRGVLAGKWPVGEAIDRAVALLVAAPHAVRVDDVTASLLDARFEIGGDGGGLYLLGELETIEVTRTLLGQQTPCVGRDRELAMLYALFEDCVHEPRAHAAVVTGVEGIGKSRVRYELIRRIRARPGETVEVLVGRGDPLHAGSPFGMIAPALRRTAGIHDGEPLEVRRQKLRARVLRNASMDLQRTTEFLAELVGAPFPDIDVELRAARHDPQLMSDQIRRAFEHFLAVETAAQPVVIILEDLHWGDLPTVKLIDSALRALPDRPWFVLAVARPEVHEMFPRLWAERGAVEVRLEELSKKGSERLVRSVLGDHATDTLVARLVERAGGNAFYLEELVRAVAVRNSASPFGDAARLGKAEAFSGGDVEALPETVLALVQGRLERLEGDARRVLRAASVFGQQFWRGGVTALLGGAARETGTRAWLDELVERELISRAPASRFAHEQQYLFRHALVREAAYAMLTEPDRKLGHELAADWLEHVGEEDAVTLAEHRERAGDRDSATEHYQRAVDQALAACDFEAAAARADRGIKCGATGETLGAFRLAQAEAHKWSGEFVDAARRGLEAMELLPRGTARWFAAAGEAAEASGKLDDVPQLTALGEALAAAPDAAIRTALAARVTASAHAAFQLFQKGNYELAQRLLDRVEYAARDVDDPAIEARIWQARSSRAMFAGDAGAYLESERAAAAAFERAGDLRYACMQRGHVGYACLEIGAYAEAERWLRDALEAGTRLGLQNVVATAKHNLGRALQHQGRLDEALAVETEALDAFREHNDRRLEGGARIYVAHILEERLELDAAERELHAAVECTSAPMHPQIYASLARVLLAHRRPGEALLAARRASDILDELGGVEEGESLVRLMLAETLVATGNHDAARDAARAARERLLVRAARITDREWRRSFVERIPENARTLALAKELRADRE